MNRENYQTMIRPFLSEKRFRHSVCVAEMAEHLARKFGADMKKKLGQPGFYITFSRSNPAGRSTENKPMKFGIILADEERPAQKLWHAIFGAAYLERELGISDREIQDAIRYHTTARANMTLLEKVVFVSRFYFGRPEV